MNLKYFRSKMSVRLALFLIAGLFLTFTASYPAVADGVTYTYTGNDFSNIFLYSCPTVCKLTGSFTVANPLAAGLNNATITPLSYSFTDGLNTFNPANSLIGDFNFFSTNSLGAITQWNIFLMRPDFSQAITTTTEGSFLDLTANFVTFAEADSETKGSWSVPEPSAFLMLLIGLTCFAFNIRKRLSFAGSH